MACSVEKGTGIHLVEEEEEEVDHKGKYKSTQLEPIKVARRNRGKEGGGRNGPLFLLHALSLQCLMTWSYSKDE